MEVRWTQGALVAFRAIVQGIAEEDRPRAARLQATRIMKAIDQLSDYPASGRAGRVPGTRELVISGSPFIAAYRVRDEKVEILTVIHGSRRWPESF